MDSAGSKGGVNLRGPCILRRIMARRSTDRRFAWGWLALLAVSAVPATAMLGLILKYGVNVPYLDQWDCEAPILKKFLEHQLGLADLWAQHNEHRMFFPRLFYLLLANLTHWNVKADLIAIWLCMCFVSFSIYRTYRSVSGPIGASGMVPFVASNVLIFSPAGVETWFWGVSLANLLPMVCVIGAMAVASSALKPSWRLGLCAVLATVATFSTASGLLCWIVCAPLLFLRGRAPRERAWSLWLKLAWIAGFLFTTVTYFYQYTRPAHHPPPIDALKRPIDALSFLLLYQGNSLTFRTEMDYVTVARIVGGTMFALLLAVCIFLLFRWRDVRMRERGLVWLMLAVYSAANGVLITLSRMEVTMAAATWTRYINFSIMLPVALVFLLPLVVEDLPERWGRWGVKPVLTRHLTGLFAIAMVFHAFKFSESIRSVQSVHIDRLQRKANLLFIDCFQQDWENSASDVGPNEIRPLADSLNEHGWINPPLIACARMQELQASNAGAAETYGRIERIGDAGNGNIYVAGWACDPRTASPADAVVLSWDRPGGDAVPFAVADMGIERSDQPAGSPLRYSGWQLVFPSSQLPKGNPGLRAWWFDTTTREAVGLIGPQ